jgi:hypothetical protein
MGFKKSVLFFSIAVNGIFAMEEPKCASDKPAIVVEFDALVLHDQHQIEKIVRDFLKTKGISLKAAAGAALGFGGCLGALADADAGQRKFFEFLAPLRVSDDSAEVARDDRAGIYYRFASLPQVLALCVLARPHFEPETVEKLVETYIGKQRIAPNAQYFYSALAHTTLDVDIAAETTIINPDTQWFIESVYDKYKLYLVGHCMPDVAKRLQKREAGVFSKFDQSLFSSQTDATPATVFDDPYWRNALKTFKHVDIGDDYFVIDDGTKGDLPRHYTCSRERKIGKRSSRPIADLMGELSLSK